MKEDAIVFGSAQSLVGVLTHPEGGRPDPAKPALIVVNAGLVHRVGPHRMHVALLRRMARCGFMGLRFDFSGIGDSLPRADMMPYTRSTVEEVREVMSAVTERTGIEKFCLIGLSSGALVSLASAGADPRIVGVCMINPHGFAASSVWGQHVESVHLRRVYTRNLFSMHSWRKLLTGKSDYRRLGKTLLSRWSREREEATEISSVVEETRPELLAFFGLGIDTLMVFSEKDRSIHNLEEILGPGWQRQLNGKVKVVEIAGANHTLASPAHLQQAVQAIDGWLNACWPGSASQAA